MTEGLVDADANRVDRAVATVKAAIADIETIQRDVEAEESYGLLEQLTKRWKERTSAELVREVSAIEATKFKKLSLTPGYDETLIDAIQQHIEFLYALGLEIKQYPEHFFARTSPNAAPPEITRTAEIASEPTQPQPLHYQERMTARWIYENVPPRFYAIAVLSLTAALLLGVRLGQIAAIVKFLSWIPLVAN